jgi:branched-chain amino acid transport system permease protein
LTDVEVKVTQAMGFQMPAPSLLGYEISSEAQWWVVLAINVLLVWAVLRWIVRGHVGRTWVLARDQPAVAATLGISVPRSRMAAFALCAFMGGTVGVLHGYYVGTVQVTNYSLHLSIVYLTVIVLGGPGRLGGAIWAAVLVTILPHALSWALRQSGVDTVGAAGVENIALGVILIVVLLGAPQRLWALLRSRGST